MNATEGAAVQMLFPFIREPAAYRHAVEIRIKLDAPVLSDTCCSFTVKVSFTSFARCQVDIMKRKRCFCDEDIDATQIKLWKQRHLQVSTSRYIIEVAGVRRNEQSRSKETLTLTAESPGHIGAFSFDSLQADTIRQKERKP